MSKQTTHRRTASSGGKPSPCRVLIVDDHAIVRHGLMQLLNQADREMICLQASNAAEAQAAIAKLRPDLVVVDISLEASNGIELTKDIRGRDPDLAILVLSMHDEALYAERALRAGANGYVMKSEAAETILKAVREVLGGGLYVSQKIASRILRGVIKGRPQVEGHGGVEGLSDRELEVFELVGRGFSTREIADRLKLSVKTIETHRAHIKHKLRIRNTTELVQRAVNWCSSVV